LTKTGVDPREGKDTSFREGSSMHHGGRKSVGEVTCKNPIIGRKNIYEKRDHSR